MTSCASNFLDFSYQAVNEPNHFLSKKITGFAREIESGEKSAFHYLWVYPINLAVSVIGIALAPVAFVIDMMAAAILTCFACCSDTCNGYARVFFALGMAQITDIPFRMFASIFYPPAPAHIEPCVLNGLVRCLEP